ncbi:MULTISPECIES: acylphosphatase [Bacteria]|jgi:Acylphosphatases|uniref:Acylphosphatase n=2 Tax=Clostridium beijerinckii TaxID=1520 RepID=ACYP_CLOB8|nr:MULTISPECIES: acylphosphatase [Bacteria]A6M163.1 RecName: Full=Acylphosphatase; AltName: Full=Acylphosphate phosphohydrolase [Clostridium beijerinckii NCIMB 8052]ABR36343.1 acylphosphatase [Clostridium beijerinckii NCIMB 8052]AIU01715.1 acylphosphatase [Clostridium beijerinckii ATCC 35702]MBF7809010.1 acylphosphatase [Clostridium beijerinckii]NRT22595.1 acylphosphatase [Clostridium beijerinckii]NRT64888.1 acylphosphatase [Clostridium beijerinckii]
MIRYSAIVQGRVQGVGFRYFIQLTACKLSLTGWCKNLMNGNVEIEVQGLENNVLSFVSEIKKGNGFAKVSDIDLNILPVLDGEKKFSIKY